MTCRRLMQMGLMAALSVLVMTAVGIADPSDLTEVRRATAQFHDLEVAQDEGYNLVPGLDYCFVKDGVGGMGYHYIHLAILDTELNNLEPEAMVYATDANGELTLGAVEYIVDAALWDAEHTEPPSVLGQHLHLHEDLGVYVLHAWIWKNNPSGIYEDWNPRVTCP
jgi:hypothetical protein